MSQKITADFDVRVKMKNNEKVSLFSVLTKAERDLVFTKLK